MPNLLPCDNGVADLGYNVKLDYDTLLYYLNPTKTDNVWDGKSGDAYASDRVQKVKNANNYSHIEPLPKAVTEGNEVPLISKKKASTKTIKDSIILLIHDTSISKDKINNDLLKTNQKEYTLNDILENNFGNDDNNECDKVGDLYSVVKKIKFELVDPKRINIWSVYNDNYESFCNEFNDKYSSQFAHNKLSDSKITNSSHSTQQNSNKKTPTVKTF